MTRWSSISLTSFRASSTGWTFVLKARPKTPSNRDSILSSMFLSTLIAGVLYPGSPSLAFGFGRQTEASGEDCGDDRRVGQGWARGEDSGQQQESERQDPAAPHVGKRRRRCGEHERLEQQRRLPAQRVHDRAGRRQRQSGALAEKGQRGGERRGAERPAGGVERQRRGPGAGDETRRRGGGKAPGCGGRELRHAALALLAPVPRRPQRGCESCSR